MFGLRLAWVPCKKMSRILPGWTVGLFRSEPAYVRGDVFLLRHPEHGALVRQIYAVGRNGRYSVEVLNSDQQRGLGFIEPEWVRAAMLFRVL
ncbi:MAG: S24/S26 family peptidase [Erythrobacter sp.]|jgi:hypothetical protein|nr:S24/S26 family peptidase [Erythrobacter sp.]